MHNLYSGFVGDFACRLKLDKTERLFLHACTKESQKLQQLQLEQLVRELTAC